MKVDYHNPESLTDICEALIFASDEPLSPLELRALILGEQAAPKATAEASPNEPADDEAIDSPVKGKRKPPLDLAVLRQAIEILNTRYDETKASFRIIEIAGGFQFATRSEYAAYVSRLYKERSRRRLSSAALETLAIIAYKQPVSKADVENIRGVNCDEVIKSLLEKNLITITGRAESVGRPLLYGTTDDFLRHFGLPSMKDLPKPREIEEMLKDETIKATTLEEAAIEYEAEDDDSITVDELIAVAKEEESHGKTNSPQEVPEPEEQTA